MTLPMCMRRPVDTAGVPPFVHAPACGLHSLEDTLLCVFAGLLTLVYPLLYMRLPVDSVDTLLCACAGLWISPDSSQAAWELVAGGEISAPLSPSSHHHSPCSLMFCFRGFVLVIHRRRSKGFSRELIRSGFSLLFRKRSRE